MLYTILANLGVNRTFSSREIGKFSSDGTSGSIAHLSQAQRCGGADQIDKERRQSETVEGVEQRYCQGIDAGKPSGALPFPCSAGTM